MKTKTFIWNETHDKTLPLYLIYLEQLGLHIQSIIITKQTQIIEEGNVSSVRFILTSEAIILTILPEPKEPRSIKDLNQFLIGTILEYEPINEENAKELILSLQGVIYQIESDFEIDTVQDKVQQSIRASQVKEQGLLSWEEAKALTDGIIEEYLDREHGQEIKDTVIYDLMITVNDKLSYEEIYDYSISIAKLLNDYE